MTSRRFSRGRDARGLKAPKGITRIGNGVVIKGEIQAGENLVIDGTVDGTIELPQHVLTIGPTGRVKADVLAKSVVVLGELRGSIRASERLSIAPTGSAEGKVSAPRLVVAHGAQLQRRA